jgi:uncharacterized protein YxjI
MTMLEKKVFFIKEQVDFMKLSGTYDIFDPDSNQQIGVAKEEVSLIMKLLRLLVNKTALPTKVNVYDYADQGIVLSMQKPFALFRSKVFIYNRGGDCLGYFQSKVFTLGGGFWVFDPTNRQVAEIKGDWKGWDFKFIAENNQQLGTITKKWAGMGKELFTSADNYVIAADETSVLGADQTALLLAAGLAIDIIFKEKK